MSRDARYGKHVRWADLKPGAASVVERTARAGDPETGDLIRDFAWLAGAIAAGEPAMVPGDPAADAGEPAGAPETIAPPWFTEFDALGDTAVERVNLPADAEAAAELAGRVVQGLPAAVTPRMRAAIRRSLTMAFTPSSAQALAADPHADNDRWTALLQTGQAFEVDGHLVWLHPVLRDFRHVPAEGGDRPREYPVSFSGTSASRTRETETTRTYETAVNRIFGLVSSAASSVLMGLPRLQVSNSSSRRRETKVEAIAGRKSIADRLESFAAGLEVRVFVDGIRAYHDVSLPDLVRVPFPEPFLRRGDAPRPSRPPVHVVPASRARKATRFHLVINAVEAERVAVDLQRRLLAARLPARAVAQVLSDLLPTMFGEQSLKNGATWWTTSGRASDPVRASTGLARSFRGHARAVWRLRRLEYEDTAPGTIRDDLGLLDSRRSASSFAGSLKYTHGVQVGGIEAGGLPAKGYLHAGMSMKWSRSHSIAANAERLPKATLMRRTPLTRYRARPGQVPGQPDPVGQMEQVRGPADRRRRRESRHVRGPDPHVSVRPGVRADGDQVEEQPSRPDGPARVPARAPGDGLHGAGPAGRRPRPAPPAGGPAGEGAADLRRPEPRGRLVLSGAARRAFRTARAGLAAGDRRVLAPEEHLTTSPRMQVLRARYAQEALRKQHLTLLGSGVLAWMPMDAGFGVTRYVGIRVRGELVPTTDVRQRRDVKLMLRSQGIDVTAKKRARTVTTTLKGIVYGAGFVPERFGGGSAEAGRTWKNSVETVKRTDVKDISRVTARDRSHEFNHEVRYRIEVVGTVELPPGVRQLASASRRGLLGIGNLVGSGALERFWYRRRALWTESSDGLGGSVRLLVPDHVTVEGSAAPGREKVRAGHIRWADVRPSQVETDLAPLIGQVDFAAAPLVDEWAPYVTIPLSRRPPDPLAATRPPGFELSTGRGIRLAESAGSANLRAKVKRLLAHTFPIPLAKGDIAVGVVLHRAVKLTEAELKGRDYTQTKSGHEHVEERARGWEARVDGLGGRDDPGGAEEAEAVPYERAWETAHGQAAESSNILERNSESIRAYDYYAFDLTLVLHGPDGSHLAMRVERGLTGRLAQSDVRDLRDRGHFAGFFHEAPRMPPRVDVRFEPTGDLVEELFGEPAERPTRGGAGPTTRVVPPAFLDAPRRDPEPSGPSRSMAGALAAADWQVSSHSDGSACVSVAAIRTLPGGAGGRRRADSGQVDQRPGRTAVRDRAGGRSPPRP